MQLPAPFGKYELLERIATGGMAEVYLARSFGVAGFEKRLVIKRIRADHAKDPRFISMFINEAKIGVHLNHPNVVQVYDLGRVGGSWYIAMEHLHGRDLTRLVKTLRAQGERLPVPVSVAIVAAVARGLAYAHGRADRDGEQVGFVHRDVSPHNVVVTFDGEVKLLDFGVARLMNTLQGHAPSRAPGHPGGGKYAYMSPEQAAGHDVDHRTDIFSLGIVLWELIVGHRLFQDPDPKEKLRKVIDAEVYDPREEGAQIDDGLWGILQKALAKDRAERYAWASLLEEDLRAWLFDNGSFVGATEIATEMARAFPADARRPPGVDLSRLVADIARLDELTDSGVTPAGTPTATPVASRLREPQGERKRVVVVVIDVDGLTALSMRLEPEQLFRRHFRLLRWMRRVADRYGGQVLRAIDDEVVLMFGVPRNRSDDLARALECALELQRSVGTLTAKGMHLQLAIGVHSGEVAIGGDRRQIRYSARGDTTRLAQRLSLLADAGEVLVSDTILRTAEADFRFSGGPALNERRGLDPRPTYRLKGRRQGLRVAGKGPWLRRGNELDVMQEALVALGKGRGSTILLEGKTGSGKSRLVGEIRDLANKRGIPFYLGRSLPYGSDPPLDAVRDLVRSIVGVDADSPRAAVDEGVRRLAQLGLGERELQAVASLVGAGEGHPGAELVWRALTRTLEGLAADTPVIVALEDLHLLPQAERRALAQLITAVVSHPVLVLGTVRGAPPRELEELGTVVRLGSFDEPSQHRLLASLLEAEQIDQALADLVSRTCEGTPLYIEEMARYLRQHEKVEVRAGTACLVQDLDAHELPDGLAGMISARIDALDPASKGALQLAAVVGQSFSAALLGEAAGVDDPTPLVIDLASHGLIARTEAGSDLWAFASELVREAALRGALGVQRRDYHRMVANAIEAIHADDLDSWAGVLAHHCDEGGRHLDAARYAFRAGEQLEQSRYLERARLQYQTGLRYVARAPDEPESWEARVQGEALLHFRTGVVSGLLGEIRTSERALQLALDIAGDAGIPWIEVRAHVELGRSYTNRGKVSLARAHLDQASALLEIDNDPDLRLETLQATAILAHEEGRNDDAIAQWNEALALAEGNPEATARSLLGLANSYLRSGDTVAATPLLTRALHAARESGDRILEGRVLNNVGLVHMAAHQYDEALSFFRAALRVREGIGYTHGVMVNHHNIGDAHFGRGDYARAYVAFIRSRDLASEIGWDRGIALNDVYIGYIDALRGREDEGLTRIDAAIASARTLGDSEVAASGALLAGRWLHERGDVARGREYLQMALEDARRFDLRPAARQIEQMLGQPDTPTGAPQRGEAERP